MLVGTEIIMSRYFHLITYLISLIISIFLFVGPISCPPVFDKIAHFLMFFLYTFYTIFIFKKFFSDKYFYNFISFYMIIGFSIASAIEIIQKSLSTRSSEFYDWLASTVGLTLAILIISIRKKLSEKEE